MQKINHNKVIINTLLKVVLAAAIFFTINNWVHIKQSFGGEVPKLQDWLNHAFTLSNLIMLVLLSVVFYMNNLKKEKERVESSNFTLEQIKAAHAKVKSGADFPSYIKEIKALGVIAYEHFVDDGRINYFGNNGYAISSDPKWDKKEIAKTGNIEQLTTALKTHQTGKTNYLTFCQESAASGVEKWVVDLNTMTCTYYDLQGTELVMETIPQ